MAATLLMEISQDENERARFRSRRKFETDMYTNLDNARYNAQIKIAKNMYAEGISIDTIVKLTELEKSDVLTAITLGNG